MTRRDIYHQTVRTALEKDGWRITHDPFRVRIGRRRLAIDLGAERLLSAEKGARHIVVEIKSFIGRSDVRDLEQALGQYILYQQALKEEFIDRELYLAVPRRAYYAIFAETIGDMLIRNDVLQIFVFDEQQEVIIQWLPK